ncbi:VWA3B protein, partial [Amia calva]|nr:VWA3B protein [Amia calva]
MLTHTLIPQCIAHKNLFGAICEVTITFVIDTSGSMYLKLGKVKDHLIEALFHRAQTVPHFTFNLVEFNSEVRRWCERSVQSSLLSLSDAVSWIRGLECHSVSDTGALLTALKCALSDPGCQVVCLITDGLLQSPAEEVRPCVALWPPIHVVYLSEERGQHSPQWLLQEMARETGGTFTVSGALEPVCSRVREVGMFIVSFPIWGERCCCYC